MAEIASGKRSISHREFVGRKAEFEAIGKGQLRLLIEFGLKPYHTVCDLGCGCLRAGRHIIPYLSEGRYYGIEPNRPLVKAGICEELQDSEINEFAIYCFDDFDLRRLPEKVDYILAQSILTHAGADLLGLILQGIREGLKESGKALLNYNSGETSRNFVGWRYPELTIFEPEDLYASIESHRLNYKVIDRKEVPSILLFNWLELTVKEIADGAESRS